MLIWEAIANHAFKQGNGLYGLESGVDADMQMISAHAYNPTKFMEYYRDLRKRLNDYLKVPSFANKEAGKAETITLRWDGSKYSATVTDSNGEVRTETKWNPHTQNTNCNDDKPEAEWNDETGTWFGLTTEDWMVETQDGLCALPFDKYTLEELRCAGNEGCQLVTVSDITISRDNTVIELGTIDDHEERTPEIGTTATVDGEKISEPLRQCRQ